MAASGSRGGAGGGWAGWAAPHHHHPAVMVGSHGYFQDPVLLGSAATTAPSGGGAPGGGGPSALPHFGGHHHHHSPASHIHDLHNSPPLPILTVPRPGSSASAAFHYGPELGRAVVDRHHGVRAEAQYLRQLRQAFPTVSPTALLLALRRNRWDVRETGNSVLDMLAGAAQFLQEYEPSTLHGGAEGTGDSPGLGGSSSRSDTASRGSVPRTTISPTMMPAAGVIGSKAPSAKSGGSGGARSQSDNDHDEDENGASGAQAGALFGGDFALPSAATPADNAAAHLAAAAYARGSGRFSFGAAPDSYADVPLEVAERRSLLLSALCEIVPHADAASVERALETRGWNFADAFVDVSALQATRLAAAGLNSAWNHYGTTAESSRAFSGGEVDREEEAPLNQPLALPHQMKLDKLTAMFPDVDHALLTGALRVTNFHLPAALDLASAMVDDQRLDVREALAEAKMQISTGSSNPASPPQQLLRTGGGSNSLSPTASLSANTGATGSGGPASGPAVPAAAVASSSMGGSGGPGSPGDNDDALYMRAVTDIDTDVDWRRCREEAYLVNAARLRTVRAAVSAYNAKDHSSGRMLMRRARELERRYHELNMICMNALEREQDRMSGFGLLDLHGFHAREAVDVVHRRVALCREKRQTRLRIVTGVGRHSRLPGRPTVLPAVAAHVNNVLATKLRWCRRLRMDENRGVIDLEILL